MNVYPVPVDNTATPPAMTASLAIATPATTVLVGLSKVIQQVSAFGTSEV